MNVAVYRHNGRVPSGIEQLVGRRLNVEFGRLARRVARVEVRLSRIGGDREGQRRSCRIHVELRPRGSVIAEATERYFASAISCAAERAARQVRKLITRRRRLNRYVQRRTAA